MHVVVESAAPPALIRGDIETLPAMIATSGAHMSKALH